MIKAILTDIEGTTTSLSFVKETLFPYARKRIGEFIRTNKDHVLVAEQLTTARQLAGTALSDDVLIQLFIRWIDEDKKITPLKALQGMIWEEGYKQKNYTSHIYEDALRNLKKWKDNGIRLYVFSSGSVQAQKLLFGHTEFGDMQPLFSGYYDTTIGAKKEPEAYRCIAKSIGTLPSEILFLSDIEEELDAADQTGMKTAWLVREGPIKVGARHRPVRSFDALTLEAADAEAANATSLSRGPRLGPIDEA